MAEVPHPSSLVRSVSSMGRAMRRQFWIWPLVAVVGLGALGWWTRRVVDDTLKRQLAGQLQTLLDTDVTALENWLKAQEDDAAETAAISQVKDLIAQLIEVAASPDGQGKAREAPPLAELRQLLNARLKAAAFESFGVVNRQGVVIASVRPELLGKPYTPLLDEVVPKVLEGKTTVSRPFKSVAILTDH